MKERKRGIGFKHAFHGIKIAIMKERNFQIHLVITLLVVTLSILFKLSLMEWLFIILVIFIVLIAEILNSGMERIIDYVKPAWHPEAKIIKDMAAGAVLLAALLAVVVGLIIFLPKIIDLTLKLL